MSRLPTTFDIFNAIAEPRRREIIALLHDGREWAVNDLVDRVSLAQPGVSKHLGVLRKVGVVTVTKRGQQRLYRLHPEQLKPIHDWVKSYERYWMNSISRIKPVAEAKALENSARERAWANTSQKSKVTTSQRASANDSPQASTSPSPNTPKKPRRNRARIAHHTHSLGTHA